MIRADAALGEEAYALQISEQKVAISASTGRGAFWGVQSLLQLLPPEVYGELLVDEGELSVPCVSIEDKPRFAWRGLMLDVARHFASADEVKRFIDLLGLAQDECLSLASDRRPRLAHRDQEISQAGHRSVGPPRRTSRAFSRRTPEI